MINSIKVLSSAFLQICLLQKAPQDIPASSALLITTLLLNLLLTILIAVIDPAENQVLVVAVTECLCLMLFVYTILALRSKVGRWIQTVTALAGTGVLISLIFMPLLIFIPEGGNFEDVPEVVKWIVRFLLLWNLVVVAHIFQHALSTLFILGVAVAIAYFAISITVIFYSTNWMAS